MSTAQTNKSYLFCLDRLKTGTASIEHVSHEADDTYVVRVQISNIGHVLTGINRQQLDALNAAAQQGKINRHAKTMSANTQE